MGVHVDSLTHNVVIPESSECLEAINASFREAYPGRDGFNSVADAFSAAGWEIPALPGAGVTLAGVDKWFDDMERVFRAAAPWVTNLDARWPAIVEFSVEGEHYRWLFANGAMFTQVGTVTYGGFTRQD